MNQPPEENKGEFLGIPYDWRPLTPQRLAKEEKKAQANHHLFIPKRFGWGYAINFVELGRRLGLRK